MDLKSLLPNFAQLAEAGLAALVIAALFYSMWKIFEHHRKERESRVQEHREERSNMIKEHREERKEWRSWAEKSDRATNKLIADLTEAIRDLNNK